MNRILSRLLMFMLMTCAWGQTPAPSGVAAVPAAPVTGSITVPILTATCNVPKNGGVVKCPVTTAVASLPLVNGITKAVNAPVTLGPVTLSGTFTANCPGPTTNPDGTNNYAGCTIVLKVSQ